MKILFRIIIKEFIQYKRDPKMFGMMLIAPIMQLIFLGYAANFDVNTIHTAVFDQSKSYESREFLRKFEGSGYFEFNEYVKNYDEIEDLIDNGKVTFAIVIPSNFESDIKKNITTKVQLIIDA